MIVKPVPPALIFLIGALIIPLLKGRLKTLFMLLLPVYNYINLLSMPEGRYWIVQFLDFQLVLGSVDRLSLIFGNIFILITLIGVIYLLHTRNDLEYSSGFLYAGAALGVVFAGDLISMFLFWEMLTVAAVFFILARKTRRAIGAAIRYLLVHVVGGLILLAGIILYIAQRQTAELGYIGLTDLASALIFIGFGVNCAWPVLHAWLPDTYPEATVGGTVFMATFTTKTAVYILARTFPGESLLVWIGAIMTAFPIFYAVIENDLRRVLSYSLINQVGFMVTGIGIGTQLSLNGTAAHAYCHILYKALLFMSMGAVLHQTGKIKATDLGGLYKSMPFTAVCCMIGAASISAFPLFSGFVSKSLIMSAATIEAAHNPLLTLVWLALVFASAGVFHHSGIKIPFFAFFSHDAGIRVKEAPLNMRIAMGITAFLCILIGVFPHATLYKLLPFPSVPYEPYTFPHVNAQLLLLIFSALAFTLLLLSGVYPPEIRAVNLDADWLYRRGLALAYRAIDRGLNGLNEWAYRVLVVQLTGALARGFYYGPSRLLANTVGALMRLNGATPEEVEKTRADVYERARKNAFPIGVTAFLAVLFLSVLFFV